ncbi:MAG: hypothetical protein AB1345_00670 [Chloroflexota bacterium]
MWRIFLSAIIIGSIPLGILSPLMHVGLASQEGPYRQTTITVPYIEYNWWLTKWSDNHVVCEFMIEHQGLPTGDEIYYFCGKSKWEQWHNTPSCPAADQEGGDTQSCQGFYLHLASSNPKERQVVVDLPAPTVWIELINCPALPPDYRCDQLPILLFTAEEPLPNEDIIAINGILDGVPYSCAGEACELPLYATQPDGITLEFWAVSSYGDTSEHYTALIRVIDTGVSTTPGENAYYVHVLSSQWRGAAISSCAQAWESFPPYGTLPEWLQTPDLPEDLATNVPYTYLAGRLIAHGLVEEAKTCENRGLLPNGAANPCGMEAARALVAAWQNRFDTDILQIGNDKGIPAFLLKSMFAQESQFWPGAFTALNEAGMGQLSEAGADTALLWNRTFYESFCPLILSTSTCQQSYTKLDTDKQAMLRGALMNYTDASCLECPAGIDLRQASLSIEVFARTLLANCEQTGRVVYNVTNQTPGQVASHEDLWRFTLSNYQAGPGCLHEALKATWKLGEPLDWEHVSQHLSTNCQSILEYIENLTH